MDKNSKYFEYCLLAVFVVLGVFGLLNHEIWRDEAQAWLISRDSLNLFNLWKNLRYEGHPGLWHLILFAVTRVTQNVHSMQCVHLVIASLSIFVFLKFSPFTKLQKFLFTFGYFPFYEYSIISRSYGLSMLISFIFCCLFLAQRRVIFIALCLFFLSQTTVFGLIIAIGFTLFFVSNSVFNIGNIAKLNNKLVVAVCAVVILFGFVISYRQIKVPSDSSIYNRWFVQYNPKRFVEIGSSIWKGYLPIPQTQLNWWNTNFLNNTTIMFSFSIVILISFILIFAKNLPILIFYFSSTCGVLLFLYLKLIGYNRHWGNLFIVAVSALWLYKGGLGIRKTKIERGVFNIAVLLLFGVNAIAGVKAYYLDTTTQFSASKKVADYIIKNNLEDLNIVGYPSYIVAPVLGYLGKNQAYYPETGNYGSFTIWSSAIKPITTEKVLASGKELSEKSKSDVLYIANDKIPNQFINNDNDLKHKPIKLKEFEGSVIPDENYYLYLLKYEN